MDALLRRDLPMQPSGISHLHAVCRAREGAVRHSAKVQRKEQIDLLGTDRPMADRQNLSARRVCGVFPGNAKRKNKDGLYPTVTVRKLMWALRMKPLKKERWETVFDRGTV